MKRDSHQGEPQGFPVLSPCASLARSVRQTTKRLVSGMGCVAAFALMPSLIAPSLSPASASASESLSWGDRLGHRLGQGVLAVEITNASSRSNPRSNRSYRVRRGDTLDSIARIYGLSVADIIRLNQLDQSSRLRIGQVILLPTHSAARAARQAPQATRQSSQPVQQSSQTARQALRPARQAPQVLAAAPLGSQSYEPLAQSLLRRSVAPELPPLDSSLFLDRASNYIWPAAGVISSGFGWRWGRMHQGLDIAAPSGTPIYAAASGVVTFSGWVGGYGNLVEIAHTDGATTLYGHNRRNLVREGQRVRQGEQIAEMGSTGRSTGPHLHFEIHAVGQGVVNPLSLLEGDHPRPH